MGCAVGFVMQLLLYNHHDILPLVLVMFWVALMICARWHSMEKGLPGIGFGAITTLAILFGQYLTPSHDIMFDIFYRLTSVSVSVVLTLTLVFVTHGFLNRFAVTRHMSH
ncbi:hypothetical protein D3C85_1558210 [compost metagenome]|jgi:hypothetical protein